MRRRRMRAPNARSCSITQQRAGVRRRLDRAPRWCVRDRSPMLWRANLRSVSRRRKPRRRHCRGHSLNPRRTPRPFSEHRSHGSRAVPRVERLIYINTGSVDQITYGSQSDALNWLAFSLARIVSVAAWRSYGERRCFAPLRRWLAKLSPSKPGDGFLLPLISPFRLQPQLPTTNESGDRVAGRMVDRRWPSN
jgi:hypothetical protein